MNAISCSMYVESIRGKGRPRVTRAGHAYTPKTTADAEAEIAALARQHMILSGAEPIPAGTPMRVSISFTQPLPKTRGKEDPTVPYTQKPDLDNCVKLVLDAVEGILYERDQDIVSLIARKDRAPHGERARIEIQVQPI